MPRSLAKSHSGPMHELEPVAIAQCPRKKSRGAAGTVRGTRATASRIADEIPSGRACGFRPEPGPEKPRQCQKREPSVRPEAQGSERKLELSVGPVHELQPKWQSSGVPVGKVKERKESYAALGQSLPGTPTTSHSAKQAAHRQEPGLGTRTAPERRQKFGPDRERAPGRGICH